jgi:hypothetical protein
MGKDKRLPATLAGSAFAASTGLSTSLLDVAAPWGDDTHKVIILLWLASCGLLGLLLPRRPWRWAAPVGLWLPSAHLALHALGRPDAIHPNNWTTVLLLYPVELAVCSVAAYGGAFLRRLALTA